MKKLISLLAVSSIVLACNGSKSKAPVKKYITYPKLESGTHKNAINTIKKDGNMHTVIDITDGQTINDKSFQELIWKGVSAYTGSSNKYYVIPGSPESQELLSTYIAAMKNTQLLVVAGFPHDAPLRSMLKNFNNKQGAIFIDGEVKAKNVMSIQFAIEEPAFYAGYASAKHLSDNWAKFDVKGSKGLKVGTYGGMILAPVTAFMSGYQQGVDYWNKNVTKDDKKVEFIKLGTKPDSYFSGNFRQGAGKAISEILLNKGADIILPVSGAQTIDTLEVISEKKSHALIVGVDTDQVTQYTDYSDKFLTSILKRMDVAVEKAIKHSFGEENYEGYGLGKTIVGNMDNELVGLAAGQENILTTETWILIKENEELKAAAKKAENKFRL